MATRIDRCRLCGNAELVSVLDLGDQALTGIFPKKGENDPPSQPLELVRCWGEDRGSSCGLVQLAHRADLESMYGDNYGYRSGLNQSMVAHLRSHVGRLRERVELKASDLIIDIGSNDSTLLQSYGNHGYDLLGVDPSAGKFASFYPDHIRLITEFFPSKKAQEYVGERKAKIVSSIAMFYDLEDPQSFVNAVSDTLDDEGVWLFEQSYLPTMLEMNSYDTVCHEHLEYYHLDPVLRMLKRAQLRIIDIEKNDINGGSFAITAAKMDSSHSPNDEGIQEFIESEREFGLEDLSAFEGFRSRVETTRTELREFLSSAKREGKKVIGYGASTKGNVLLQHCGIDRDLLPCIAEVNEDKFGARTPGSRIPIISEKEAREQRPDYFLVLPWHFRNTIIQKEQSFLDQGGRLVFPLPNVEIV